MRLSCGLIEKGLVTGLRIDHVDGLRDPLGYLRRLQERVGRRVHERCVTLLFLYWWRRFLLMAKPCLASGRSAEQPDMTSLNALNGLFLDPEGCRKLRPDL